MTLKNGNLVKTSYGIDKRASVVNRRMIQCTIESSISDECLNLANSKDATPDGLWNRGRVTPARTRQNKGGNFEEFALIGFENPLPRCCGSGVSYPNLAYLILL
ncbi:MAG: hypothetical protein OXN17_02415 [Candidatus Poribacteria bacterium]|nr:hypothetical protein [Candidatus Poribacteria bacterium]